MMKGISTAEIQAKIKDVTAHVMRGSVTTDMMVCVHQKPGEKPKIMVSKYDGRPQGVCQNNKDGSIEFMAKVIEVNKQLAALIKKKETELRSNSKSIGTMMVENGDGVKRHGRFILRADKIEAMTFSADPFGGRSLSYDDLLTMNLQGKVEILGTSIASNYLKLACRRHKEDPSVNAKELFKTISTEFGVNLPQLDEPESRIRYQM